MSHDEYWTEVWHKAHKRLEHLFEDSRKKVHHLVGDDNGIDSYDDAKKVLAFVLECQTTAGEKACAILSVMECLIALHELHEHAEAKPAGVMVR